MTNLKLINGKKNINPRLEKKKKKHQYRTHITPTCLRIPETLCQNLGLKFLEQWRTEGKRGIADETSLESIGILMHRPLQWTSSRSPKIKRHPNIKL